MTAHRRDWLPLRRTKLICRVRVPDFSGLTLPQGYEKEEGEAALAAALVAEAKRQAARAQVEAVPILDLGFWPHVSEAENGKGKAGTRPSSL